MLIKCPECELQVSDKAMNCPHCGYPITSSTPVRKTSKKKHQRRKVKDFFIKFKKKSHFADFLTKHTLDFVLHRLLGGLAEMDTDDIGGLANLLSDSRASGGVGCGIVHSKSSCK